MIARQPACQLPVRALRYLGLRAGLLQQEFGKLQKIIQRQARLVNARLGLHCFA